MKIISKTQSICSECRRPADAAYIEEGGQIFFRKTCEAHGTTQTLAARYAEDFTAWVRNRSVNVPPREAITSGKEGECPLHCGTCEQHLQTACCVLIDVTDRCNQRCPYCFAAAGEGQAQDPSLFEIARKYDRLLALGEERPFNIQLSGGEPTVRDDLPEIVRMGREKGFEYIQLNTNGKRIALEEGYAEKLKEAGASVIFLQFDGTREEIHVKLRSEPLLEIKKQAIENCRQAGLPVTLVPTITRSVNLDNVGEMIRFMLSRLDVVKGIHFQPASFFGRHPGEQDGQGDYEDRVTMFDVMHAICEQTGGMFRYEDLCAISTGHSLCCFCGTFMREQSGEIKGMISKETKECGVSCCEVEDPLAVIRKDRDFVLNKWEVVGRRSQVSGEGSQAAGCGCQEVMSFDDILVYLRRNMFTLSGMAFMDIGNLDAERLSRCRVQVFSEDDRLIPFCAYNSIYRERKE